MSPPSSDSGRETDSSLYNPSSDDAEELDPDSIQRDVLDLEISRDLATRLLEVSKHLGLNPSIVASRAIDLVCDEIGTLDADWQQDQKQYGTVTLIQRYQARVDLLQALQAEAEESDTEARPAAGGGEMDETGREFQEENEALWEAVDDVIDLLSESDEEKNNRGLGLDVSVLSEDDEVWPLNEDDLVVAKVERRAGNPQSLEEEADDASGWEAVETIIEAGEEAKGQ